MYELKPCPFCGGDAEFQQTGYGTTDGNSVKLSFQVICKKCDATAPKSYGSVRYYVRCPDCGAETVPDRIKEAAIHKWNMRVKNAREAAEE